MASKTQSCIAAYTCTCYSMLNPFADVVNYFCILEQKNSNANAIPETRSRRCLREQRDQPNIK